MNRLTILLIIIAIIGSGVGGFILGAQNSQLIPAVKIANNTTNDSDHSTNLDTSKNTKNTTKQKTDTTVKKNITNTNSTPKTNGTTNTTPTP